jgi:hypothetical protein
VGSPRSVPGPTVSYDLGRLASLDQRQLVALSQRLDAAVRDPYLDPHERSDLLMPAAAARIALCRRRAAGKAAEARQMLAELGVSP